MHRLHHYLDMFAVVHCAQSGKHVQRVLAEAHAVVLEMSGSLVVLVPPQDTVLLGNPHRALDAGQVLHVLDLE
jgi:hypothetical protein